MLFEPGWEPSLFALSSASAVVFSESYVKNYIKEKYQSYKSNKIIISEGEIIADDEELMKFLRPLCLGEDVSIDVRNLEDDILENHARKKVKDENERYYLLAQVDRRKKKLDLCSEGIKKIAELYRQGFIRCRIDNLPNVVRRYVSVIYPPLPNSSGFLERHKETAFDVYSNSVIKGEISFIADIPSAEVDEIVTKLEIKSTQDMCAPYFYSVLQIPERILHEYIIPAQVSYGLTRYKEIADDNYWAPQNWAIGPH
jgi:hypothetical protein